MASINWEYNIGDFQEGTNDLGWPHIEIELNDA